MKATVKKAKQDLIDRLGADTLVFDRNTNGGFDVSKTRAAGFNGSHVRVYDEGVHVAAYAFAPGRRSPQVAELDNADQLVEWIAERL